MCVRLYANAPECQHFRISLCLHCTKQYFWHIIRTDSSGFFIFYFHACWNDKSNGNQMGAQLVLQMVGAMLIWWLCIQNAKTHRKQGKRFTLAIVHIIEKCQFWAASAFVCLCVRVCVCVRISILLFVRLCQRFDASAYLCIWYSRVQCTYVYMFHRLPSLSLLYGVIGVWRRCKRLIQPKARNHTRTLFHTYTHTCTETQAHTNTHAHILTYIRN